MTLYEYVNECKLFTDKQLVVICFLLHGQMEHDKFLELNVFKSSRSLSMTIHCLNKKVGDLITTRGDHGFDNINLYKINVDKLIAYLVKQKGVNNVYELGLSDYDIETIYNEEIQSEFLPINNTRQSHDVLCSFNDYLINSFHGFQYDLCEMKNEGLKNLLYKLLTEILIDDEYEDLIQCLSSNTDLYQVCLNINPKKTKNLIAGFKQALLFQNEDCDFYQLAKNHLINVCGYDLDSNCYDSIEDFKKNEVYIDYRDIIINFDKAALIEDYFIEFKSMHDFFNMSYDELINKILEAYTIDACNSYYTQPFKDLHENLTHEYRNLLQVIEDLIDKGEKITLNKILSYQWIYTDKIMFKGVVFNIGAFSNYHELMFTDYLTGKGLI